MSYHSTHKPGDPRKPMMLPGSRWAKRTVKAAHGRARLTLAINGQSYNVRPVPCDPGAGVSKCFELRKADGTVYHASQHESWSECTCPDFVWARDGLAHGPCKHLAALAATGLLASTD